MYRIVTASQATVLWDKFVGMEGHPCNTLRRFAAPNVCVEAAGRGRGGWGKRVVIPAG